MSEMNEIFVMVQNEERQNVFGFDEEATQYFAGIKFNNDGSLVVYFQMPRTTTVSEAENLDSKLVAQFLRVREIIKYARTSFDIINGGTGPFQIAYEIRFR